MELLPRTKVPEAHHSPSRVQRLAIARQLRCRPKDVQWTLVLLAPQCIVAEQYFSWFHGLPQDLKAGAVPPMIMSRPEYAARTKHTKDENGVIQSAMEFARGFRKLNRPPHYAFIADAPPPTSRPNE